MAISAGVKVIPLSIEEMARSGFTHRCRIPYSTVAAVGGAATTATVAVLDVAVGDVVNDRCAYVITESWDASDASLNSITISVGDDGDVDRYMPVTTPQLAEDGTEVDYFVSLGGSTPATSTAPFVYTTANTVDVLFTVAGGGSPLCSELTSGSVDVFLSVYSLPPLSGRSAAGS